MLKNFKIFAIFEKFSITKEKSRNKIIGKSPFCKLIFKWHHFIPIEYFNIGYFHSALVCVLICIVHMYVYVKFKPMSAFIYFFYTSLQIIYSIIIIIINVEVAVVVIHPHHHFHSHGYSSTSLLLIRNRIVKVYTNKKKNYIESAIIIFCCSHTAQTFSQSTSHTASHPAKVFFVCCTFILYNCIPMSKIPCSTFSPTLFHFS